MSSTFKLQSKQINIGLETIHMLIDMLSDLPQCLFPFFQWKTSPLPDMVCKKKKKVANIFRIKEQTPDVYIWSCLCSRIKGFEQEKKNYAQNFLLFLIPSVQLLDTESPNLISGDKKKKALLSCSVARRCASRIVDSVAKSVDRITPDLYPLLNQKKKKKMKVRNIKGT